jgi:hypothetical protein
MMAMMVVAGVLLWAGTGCEEAKGLEAIGLTITPETLSASNRIATCAATLSSSNNNSLAFPLEWRVSSDKMGYIKNPSGSQALYVANKYYYGQNIVTVRDQYGNEGSAVVTQEE